MYKRFRWLKGVIRDAVIDADVFGLDPRVVYQPPQFDAQRPRPQRRQFDFPTTEAKISAFMEWLREMEDRGILEVYQRDDLGRPVARSEWQNYYVLAAYQQGITRARNEMRGAGVDVPREDAARGVLAPLFRRRHHIDDLNTLYTRNFTELRGITEAMDQQISRELAEGFLLGEDPRRIARRLNKRVDKIGLTRARVLARTEVIRAHHIAQINEYESLGATGVRVLAEWGTAGVGVCPICRALEGRVFTLAEIRGMIPRHPNCRCTAIPVLPDETG
jgi:SPP1 gp7 family putative phage head morphogenesis protein